MPFYTTIWFTEFTSESVMGPNTHAQMCLQHKLSHTILPQKSEEIKKSASVGSKDETRNLHSHHHRDL